MGQQQLLLLVLSAIIVGVSIVIGINMFASSAVQANQDAVLQDCLHIAGRAQEWLRKPEALGGGGGTFTGGGGLYFASINLDCTTVNVSQDFTWTIEDSLLTILGTGTEGSPLTVTVAVSRSRIVSTVYTQ